MPLKQPSPRRLLIARDEQEVKHSQRYVLVEGKLAHATNATAPPEYCRDRFDFPGGSWPAIARATKHKSAAGRC